MEGGFGVRQERTGRSSRKRKDWIHEPAELAREGCRGGERDGARSVSGNTSCNRSPSAANHTLSLPASLTPRKLAVFEEIAMDARRAIAEHRVGIPDGTVISHTSGVPANDRFTPPGQQQGRFDQAPVSDRVGQAANAEIQRRAGAPSAPPASGKESDDDMACRQREFDEMLERERKGGEESKRW